MLSHAVAATAISAAWYRPRVPKFRWMAGIACSVIPDLDVIGFRFGIHYGDFWGHRGFTHSLIFAVLVAGILTVAVPFRRSQIHRASLFAHFVSVGGKPWLARRDDKWRTWRRVLLPVRQHPIFSAMEADSRFSHWGYEILQSPRSSGPSVEDSVDLASLVGVDLTVRDFVAIENRAAATR